LKQAKQNLPRKNISHI